MLLFRRRGFDDEDDDAEDDICRRLLVRRLEFDFESSFARLRLFFRLTRGLDEFCEDVRFRFLPALVGSDSIDGE
jgi:hypothetical protein